MYSAPLNHIYAQIIDDVQRRDPGRRFHAWTRISRAYGGNKEAAKKVGKLIAKRAADKGITEVVFDRGGYIYHGRVKELAEGAREGGLKF